MAPKTATQPALSTRKFDEHVTGGPNAHKYWYRVRNDKEGKLFGPLRIVFNYLVIYAAKHLPVLSLKRWCFNHMLGTKLAKNVTIASGVTLDYFFPELIEIGENTIVGMDTMILTHEFMQDRWRAGKVTIGTNVMVGAETLVLCGTTIENQVVISGRSLVNRSIPCGAFVGGNPAKIIKGA